jgi:5,6-dimethylbenzimidazole synthase
MPPPPEFDDGFRECFRELLVWRRDVRRFRADALPAGTIEALIEAASLAPSVGLSEPWRFALVDDPARRRAVRENFADCNADALAALAGERALHYAQLKLAGLDEAPVHLAVFADHATLQGHGLGRRTMPETIEYSAVMAVHTLWLMARTLGIGVGWVSILDPTHLAASLEIAAEWRFIGYFCLGYPAEADDVPALERAAWECRRDAATFLFRR